MLFDPQPPVLAQTTLGDEFPVRRIFCVGRNYAEHAREMGKDPTKEPPFFFTKWAETIVPSGSTVAYPAATESYHHEAELVVAIGRGGRDIPVERALEHVLGYATGLDMTRRDLQLAARATGRPWDSGKNFEEASPLGPVHPVSEVGHPTSGAIRLTVNGDIRQSADLADLIWPVADIIAFLSALYRIEPGDLIYTGTPAGVGAVHPGDEVVIAIDGLEPTRIMVGTQRQV